MRYIAVEVCKQSTDYSKETFAARPAPLQRLGDPLLLP
jgi:hypothetical protein